MILSDLEWRDKISYDMSFNVELQWENGGGKSDAICPFLFYSWNVGNFCLS